VHGLAGLAMLATAYFTVRPIARPIIRHRSR